MITPARRGIPLALTFAFFSLELLGQTASRKIELGDVLITLGNDSELTAGDLIRAVSIEGVPVGSDRPILNVALAETDDSHSRWTLLQVIRSGPLAAEAVFRSEALPNVRLYVAFEATSRQVDSWPFNGFRYRYRVEGWNRPGAEIVETARWILGGNPLKTTHVIASIYGPQLYRSGMADAPTPWDGPTFPGSDEPALPPSRKRAQNKKVDTWVEGRLHSRFGKLDGFEFQVSDTGDGLLVSLDQPALQMAGHKTGGDDPSLVVTDHSFLDGTPPTGVWRDVLLTRNGVHETSSVSIGNFWLRIAWAERERVREAAGLKLPDAGLMVATGPRFELTKPLLPMLRALGVEWVSVGPIWESSATEGGKFSSMSVWNHRVAEKWGGIEALRDFCAAAEQENIKVLAWFGFHVSKESNLSRREGFTATRLAEGDDLVVLNLKNPAVRAELIESIRLVRDAGVRGLWLDAYHSLGLEVVTEEGGARLPQVREVLAIQRELQAMGITQFVEAWTPFGISSHGIIGERLGHYERWPFFGLSMVPYAHGPHGDRSGLDLKEIDYGRFLAMRSSLFAGLHVWEGRTGDTELLGQNGDLATLNRRFAVIRPRMHRPLGWLQGFQACVWEDMAGERVLWSCTDGLVPVPETRLLRDLESGGLVHPEQGAFLLQKDRIYERVTQ